MATSAYPTFQNLSPLTQVTLHASLKNAQLFSMITPPIYLLSKLVLRRGMPFSIRRLMNATTRWTIIGAGTGALAGYGRLYNQPPVAVQDRAYRLANNASQIRTDDYSFIGASLGAIISPAIFLRRASFPGLVIGGAGIGLGAGTLVHIVQMFTEGEDVRPEGMVTVLNLPRGDRADDRSAKYLWLEATTSRLWYFMKTIAKGRTPIFGDIWMATMVSRRYAKFGPLPVPMKKRHEENSLWTLSYAGILHEP